MNREPGEMLTKWRKMPPILCLRSSTFIVVHKWHHQEISRFSATTQRFWKRKKEKKKLKQKQFISTLLHLDAYHVPVIQSQLPPQVAVEIF